MNRKFLAIGECMVELSPAGDGLYRSGFAGDTFNTCWYMNKLAGERVDTRYFTGVGDDAISSRMTTFIRDCGIGFAPKIVPDASVGLYMISLKNGERSFSYWRSASAARQLAQGLSCLADIQAGDLVYFSGITVAILLPDTRAHFLDQMALARENGAVICFDPNLRPKLWTSANEMCDWTSNAAATSDIVLPSHEDEASFFGDPDPAATAKRYRDLGADLVVVKDGPNDVLLCHRDAAMQSVRPNPVTKIVDSTAAGDAFNAGFLSHYMAGGDLKDAVRRACDISGQVIAQHGALVDIIA